ncbi:hypothetical protein GCM10012287_16020 [Streptomyces daqingensis]|uniref:Uncharacterized protein n=1 Tax=Streptomyces daqingensis TaxID=1472640 RepID=A0ABQ2M2W7_9ACTN|nr:hypothetical protein GCM10012287_16020 [Streptomyces daqingensis]
MTRPPLKTRETVAGETPAARATSLIVATRLLHAVASSGRGTATGDLRPFLRGHLTDVKWISGVGGGIVRPEERSENEE